MTNQIADYVELRLASQFNPTSDSTIDLVEIGDIYGLKNQKTDEIFQDFRLTMVEKTDVTQKITAVVSGVVANGSLGGKNRYTATVAQSPLSNNLVGVANVDDGTDADDNIIATNVTDLTITAFSTDSVAFIKVGTAEYTEITDRLDTALEEVNQESSLIAAGQNSKIRQNDARLTDQQNAYETSITAQQDAYETTITTQQDTFETEQQQNFDNFTATQRDITGVKDDTVATQLNISGGSWLDGTTEFAFVATNVTPALSATTFYELEAGTGGLVSNTEEFTSGNFPICKVTTDATEITEVKNYGAAYLVGGAGGGGSWDGVMTNIVYTDGLLTSFDDADGVTWTYTYDGDNQIVTIFDGADTTTINRDSDGTFIGTTLS